MKRYFRHYFWTLTIMLSTSLPSTSFAQFNHWRLNQSLREIRNEIVEKIEQNNRDIEAYNFAIQNNSKNDIPIAMIDSLKAKADLAEADNNKREQAAECQAGKDFFQSAMTDVTSTCQGTRVYGPCLSRNRNTRIELESMRNSIVYSNREGNIALNDIIDTKNEYIRRMNQTMTANQTQCEQLIQDGPLSASCQSTVRSIVFMTHSDRQTLVDNCGANNLIATSTNFVRYMNDHVEIFNNIKTAHIESRKMEGEMKDIVAELHTLIGRQKRVRGLAEAR